MRSNQQGTRSTSRLRKPKNKKLCLNQDLKKLSAKLTKKDWK